MPPLSDDELRWLSDVLDVFITPPAGPDPSSVGGGGGGGDNNRVFQNLTDDEIDAAVNNATPGPMLQVRGQTRDARLRLGAGQGDYWGAEPDTGMTVQEWNVDAARGLPKLGPDGNPLPPPHGDVATRVRLHSPDPNAPAGSPSAEDWTMNIEQGRDRRMLPDNTWFDTRFENSPSGRRIDVRPYSRAADGTVIETATNAPVVDPEIVAAFEANEAKMAASHIPLFPHRGGATPSDPSSGHGGGTPGETPFEPMDQTGLSDPAVYDTELGPQMLENQPPRPSTQPAAPASSPTPAGQGDVTSPAPESEPAPSELTVPDTPLESMTPPESAGADNGASASDAAADGAGLGGAAGDGLLGGGIAGGMALYDDVGKVRSGQMSVGDAAKDVGGKTVEGGGLSMAGKMLADATAGGGGDATAAAAGGGGDAVAGAAGDVAGAGGVVGGVVSGGMALIDDVGKVQHGKMTGGHAAVDVAAKTAVGVGAGIAGAVAGAEIGAAVGSVIPVAGTAVGLVAGAVVGGAVGYVGSALMDTEGGKAVLNAAGDGVDKAVGGVKEAGGAIGHAATTAGSAVEHAAGDAAHAVSGAANAAAHTASNAASTVEHAAGDAAHAVGGAVNGATNAAAHTASSAAGAVEKAGGSAAKAVSGAATSAVHAIESLF